MDFPLEVTVLLFHLFTHLFKVPRLILENLDVILGQLQLSLSLPQRLVFAVDFIKNVVAVLSHRLKLVQLFS